MLKGLSLVQLASKIEAQKTLKRDFIVDSGQLSMTIQDDKVAVLDIPGQGSFPVNELAHDQIGARLQIPSKFYDRIRKDVPDLLATNVNTLFRNNPEKRMVRTLGGDTRAFLSNRYNRIENEEIAEVALPVLASIPDVKIVSAEVTERRLYIQAVSPRLEGEVKRGDVVQAGVVISNSEVGCGSVSVSPMIYRLVCLNGMIAADNRFRANHVGRNIEDNADLWRDDTRKADDRAVLLKVRDMVTAAVDQVRFLDRINKMSGLAEARVTGDPGVAVEVLAKKVGATDEESGGILRALIEGGDLSAWGLLNAITAQAHTARSYDRAVEFETMGGQLLELAPSEWKQVLQAA